MGSGGLVSLGFASGSLRVRFGFEPGEPGEPGEPATRRLQPLPVTLLHAVEALEADDVLMGALDGAGEGVASYFANLQREEFFSWHRHVSPWEIERYLQAY